MELHYQISVGTVSSRPSSIEASHKTHRPHIKVGKDAEEEVCIVLHVMVCPLPIWSVSTMVCFR